MKNISYDLIEKLRASGSGEAAENGILREMKDPAWLYALSPSRENLFEWYPWNKKMSVLVFGADYGSVCRRISERVGALHVMDSRPENLEVLRFRYPERMQEQGGNISLYRTTLPIKYDVVLIPQITWELIRENVPRYDTRAGEGTDETAATGAAGPTPGGPRDGTPGGQAAGRRCTSNQAVQVACRNMPVFPSEGG